MIEQQSNAQVESAIASLPVSLQHIARTLSSGKVTKPSGVIKAIKEANVKPEDLSPWADFDHPDADSYGRKLVYKGDNFEIMVMSWRPGDFSAIHDHGYTQWGAVQIFGPAEHATFRIEDGYISTLNRWNVKPGDIVGVGHELVHQMGNTTSDTFFLSLHVYGEREAIENITGDARVFDLENETIQRVDGGVFFALPPEGVKRIEEGPRGDFPTRLRHMVELIRRLEKMEKLGVNKSGKDL
ncbi:MAG: cysteine dioxygenase family protein, partial [Saprospiraceae bacterium]|nr:cysteine dioxygenase family protein [Saprospiraceae bacterium]